MASYPERKRDELWQPFTKDAAQAESIITAEATGMQFKFYRDALPREVCDSAHVAAVNEG